MTKYKITEKKNPPEIYLKVWRLLLNKSIVL